MELVRGPLSPNHTRHPIEVQFLVLHYTAVDLQRTLEIFADPARRAAAHLVIDLDGTVYECVPCWEGEALCAWHAGQSHWFDGERDWETLNDHAIGIELVNFNGNLIPFAETQYAALAGVVAHLRTHYPALAMAERVLGHEQIAGRRGKADPGWRFDWPRFFAVCYPQQLAPSRQPVYPPELRDALAALLDIAPGSSAEANRFWERISSLAETSVALIMQGR